MNEITGPQILKYLKLYNADINWETHLQELMRQISKRYSDPEKAKQARHKQAACAILLPSTDKTTISDPPEALLFKCHTYHQFNAKDWVAELQKVIKKDDKIKEVREEALAMGVVYPLEYNPITRQAYRWLTEQAEFSLGSLDEEVNKKLKNLVYAYGGAVICNVFNKPEYKPKLNKVLNWRSGYFFEHLIHEVYSPEEILKIKTQELLKIKNTDPKLIKLVKAKESTMETSND